MTSDNQNTTGKITDKSVNEEYQYPNEEYVAETTPPEEQPPEPEKRSNVFMRMIQNNKRVTVVVVVVIVALIAFKFMKSDSETASQPVQQPVVQQPVAPPVQQPVAPPSTQVESQLGGLTQEAQTNQAAISQLQNQVQALQSQLGEATAAQAQLNQSMVVLVDQVKQLTAELHVVKPAKKPVKATPKAPPMIFHLKAVVPGRAWIMSNDGLSESVSVGDTVPQYGTVKVVDANRGMVITSSGKVISYGSNDH